MGDPRRETPGNGDTWGRGDDRKWGRLERLLRGVGSGGLQERWHLDVSLFGWRWGGEQGDAHRMMDSGEEDSWLHPDGWDLHASLSPPPSSSVPDKCLTLQVSSEAAGGVQSPLGVQAGAHRLPSHHQLIVLSICEQARQIVGPRGIYIF